MEGNSDMAEAPSWNVGWCQSSRDPFFFLFSPGMVFSPFPPLKNYEINSQVATDVYVYHIFLLTYIRQIQYQDYWGYIMLV